MLYLFISERHGVASLSKSICMEYLLLCFSHITNDRLSKQRLKHHPPSEGKNPAEDHSFLLWICGFRPGPAND